MSNKNVKKPKQIDLPKCAFQMAVESTAEIKTGFKTGLQAIKHSERNKIKATSTNKIQGSVDIDKQVKNLYPNENRWDYALSYDDVLYFFEIHPAETSEVRTVIEKVKWLKQWLKTKATRINALPKAEHPYIWIQSGRNAILPESREEKMLSIAGITITKHMKL